MCSNKPRIISRVLPAIVAAVLNAYVQPLLADPPEGSCIPSEVEIIWSDPADGFVDPRQVADDEECPDGIRTISVEFSDDVDLSTNNCIQIITTGGDTPVVTSATEDNGVWTIELSEPIPAGETTAIAFGGGAASLVIHSHPGDVNLDGVTNDDDRIDLEDAIATSSAVLTRHDYNRDGQVGATDTSRLFEYVAEHESQYWDLWEGAAILCCCSTNACSVTYGSSCTGSSSAVTCPCQPNPCAPGS